MEYISVDEFSKKINLSKRRIQKLCETKRIIGAKMISNIWVIPNDATKPQDKRKKVLNNRPDYLSFKELCKLLSISEATGKNWIKSEKITPQLKENNSYFFTQEYVDALKNDIISGKNPSLKSRRNKKFLSGYKVYSSYINEASKNISVIDNLINEITLKQIHLDNNAQSALLAECALQLILSKNASVQSSTCLLRKFLKGNLGNLKHKSLVDDLIVDKDKTLELIDSYPSLFNFTYVYEPENDILGLLYISTQNVSNRKATGSYYTPNKIVKHLLDKLVTLSDNLQGKSVLDPCCGTGNFLLQLPLDFNISNVHGNDIDSIAVKLTRINLALKYNIQDDSVLYENITNYDYLLHNHSTKYDYILGNPPWGYSYDDLEKKNFSSQYSCVSEKSIESYDMFIEKALSQLSPNGKLSYILPEAVLNVKTHAPIRKKIITSHTISYLAFLGNVFDKVNCPSIILQLKNTGTKFNGIGTTINNGKNEYTLKMPRVIDENCFTFNSDEEEIILNKIQTHPNCKKLKNNATFALGIVTGDNKRYLSTTKTESNEPVLKGMDILKYKLIESKNFLTFTPNLFQQVAPETYYRAPEKLLYRFICNQLVFAYDNNQTLSLNSCNIVIPQFDDLEIKYILGILNSRIAQFFFKKQFNSVKVLRSHIEQIPLPLISYSQQKELIHLVDLLSSETDKQQLLQLYNELDVKIAEIFNLSSAEYQALLSFTKEENLFLY